MKHISLLICLFLAGTTSAQPPVVHLLQTAVPSSIRALSAVTDSIIWIAGSNGYVGRSTNGGKQFDPLPVPGMDAADFRTLYAFDENKAVVACTGSPGKIFCMVDGATWNEVYNIPHKDAFIDGMDFWNEKDGILYGDPLDDQLLLLRTSDGGCTWEELSAVARPMTAPGESSFAASGTNIRCFGDSKVVIATGGHLSRLLVSEDKGETWTFQVTPMLQGIASTGIFSFDYFDSSLGVIVGGDHTVDTLKKDHVFYTTDGGLSWQVPVNPTGGYRECVTFIDGQTVIAVGPSGIDWSVSACRNWETLSDVKGLHVVRKSRQGSRIFVAGKQVFGEILLK